MDTLFVGIMTKFIVVAFLLLHTSASSSSSSSSSPRAAGMLKQLFQYIDDHQNQFVQRLREWVTVQSNSGDHTKWGEVERILNMTAVRIQEMGGTVDFADIGTQQLPSGETVPLPPVILAEFERDPKKATLCIYGHVDVQPAKMADGWTTDPFNLTEIKGNLYGRGATDNKGPVLAWLHAVESYQATEKEIPVNIKLIIEGLEEVGSYGLLELTRKRNDSFFADVDFIVISDNVWATRNPALTYGTRGSSYFFVEVDGPKLDFHSGVYGGSIQEPMSDLIALLGSLLDHTGKILVPGVTDDVAPLTEDERKLYDNISFDLEEMKSVAGVKHFLQDTKEEVLMARWRNPSLSIHGIQGAFSEPGTKTVIPKQVTGKFSIRQVPNMDPPDVERKVKEHLLQVFSTLKSPNRLRVTATVGAKPWVANLKDPQYVAGQRAVREVFGVEPELIREGSTIPIAQNFQEETGKSVMMLPIGGHDDGEHSQNEKISRYNYIEGTKLFAAYMYELSLVK
ncbi:beta-Ala-His dipeptidase [Oncorhynchus kisutch]|uniref:Carnosine dipeptidase 1 n=1 Tax=Oncorhynchus kisutch TaxID=8019 RepID=A0A8C7DE04_ONCKI|nr:beta-Ala-His dipeptidase [Oncorhynchus kisutch]